MRTNYLATPVTFALAEGDGPLAFYVEHEFIEPLAGTRSAEKIEIGTEDDPRAKRDETWRTSEGAKRLKNLFIRLGMEPTDRPLRELFEEAKGKRCIVSIVHGGNDAPVIDRYYREGDAPIGEVRTQAVAPEQKGVLVRRKRARTKPGPGLRPARKPRR